MNGMVGENIISKNLGAAAINVLVKESVEKNINLLPLNGKVMEHYWKAVLMKLRFDGEVSKEEFMRAP